MEPNIIVIEIPHFELFLKHHDVYLTLNGEFDHLLPYTKASLLNEALTMGGWLKPLSSENGYFDIRGLGFEGQYGSREGGIEKSKEISSLRKADKEPLGSTVIIYLNPFAIRIDEFVEGFKSHWSKEGDAPVVFITGV